MPKVITNHDERRMLEMAHAGHTVTAIADAIGCGRSTAWSRTKYINPRRSWSDDPARRARILAACESVPPGERDLLVDRFGFKNLASLNVALCRHRKRARLANPSCEALPTPEPSHG